MHHAVAGIGGVFQAGDETEDTLLFRILKAGLETDDIVHGFAEIVAPELDHGEGLFAGFRIREAHGLHGAEGRHHAAALRHAFDGHASLEDVLFLKAVDFSGFGGDQLVDKAVVFLLCHRAVEIIVSPAVAAEAVHFAFVQGFPVHNGCGGIIKIQGGKAGKLRDGGRHFFAGERAGGNNHRSLRNRIRLLTDDFNEGVMFQGFGDAGGEALPVHGQGVARGHAGLICPAHDQRIKPAHFFLQETDGIGKPVAPETVGTDQFGKGGGVMRGRRDGGPHFDKADANAPFCQLPGGFGARQAGADHSGLQIIHQRLPLRGQRFYENGSSRWHREARFLRGRFSFRPYSCRRSGISR